MPCIWVKLRMLRPNPTPRFPYQPLLSGPCLERRFLLVLAGQTGVGCERMTLKSPSATAPARRVPTAEAIMAATSFSSPSGVFAALPLPASVASGRKGDKTMPRSCPDCPKRAPWRLHSCRQRTTWGTPHQRDLGAQKTHLSGNKSHVYKFEIRAHTHTHRPTLRMPFKGRQAESKPELLNPPPQQVIAGITSRESIFTILNGFRDLEITGNGEHTLKQLCKEMQVYNISRGLSK